MTRIIIPKEEKERFERWLTDKNLKQSTIYQYTQYIKGLESFDIDLDIEQLIEHFRNELKKRSYNMSLVVLRQFLFYLGNNYGYNIEKITDILFVKLTAKKMKEFTPRSSLSSITELDKKILKRDEIKLMIENCVNDYEELVIRILFDTGCRLGEICALEEKDVNFEEKSIFINKTFYKQDISTPPKSENSIRTVEIRDRTRDLLKIMIKSRKTFHSKQFIFKIVKSIGIRSGLRLYGKGNINTRISPNWFRHSCATDLAILGTPKEKIQKYLGHSSITTTEIYINWVEAKKKLGIIDQYGGSDI